MLTKRYWVRILEELNALNDLNEIKKLGRKVIDGVECRQM